MTLSCKPKRERKEKPEWPKQVQPGRAIVRVYRRKTPQGNFTYMVANYADGERRRFDWYANEADALDAAEKLAKRLDARDYVTAAMTRDQTLQYANAVAWLKPFNVNVDAATATVAEWLKVTGDLANIHAAVKFYAARHKQVSHVNRAGMYSPVPEWSSMNTLPKMGSRRFSAGCLASALTACRILLSNRRQQQADELPAENHSWHPVKTSVFYFLVELPETGLAITWIGGGLKRSKRLGHVWLTSPHGDPILEAPGSQVHPSGPEDLARRILAKHRLGQGTAELMNRPRSHLELEPSAGTWPPRPVRFKKLVKAALCRYGLHAVAVFTSPPPDKATQQQSNVWQLSCLSSLAALRVSRSA